MAVNENLKDEAKQLKGLASDAVKLNKELQGLAKGHKDMLGSALKQSNMLVLAQKDMAKAGDASLKQAEKLLKTQTGLVKIAKIKVSFVDAEKSAYESQRKTMEDVGSSAGAFLGKLRGMITPLNIMLAAALWLGKVFYDWNKRGEEFRITTGIVGDQFAKLNNQAMGVAAELGHLGISQKEALEYTQALTEEFGSIDVISKDLVRNTAIISVTMGISADEATKLMSSFMTITAGSSEMATNMIGFTATLSKGAGVARNMVMKDIADNAESLAGYMKEGGKNIVVAAVQARQLGVSIGTVVNAADKLLDFESSIEAQMNAMLLTGRNINTERARGLAIQGDLAGLQKEILSQVGSQAEFEEMNVIQRRALAEAFGMNVGELGKMISRQETLKQLTDGQIDAAEAMSRGMSLADVLGTNKEVMSGLTQLTNALVKLGNFVATFLVPTFTVLADTLGIIATGMNIVFDFVGDLLGLTSDTTEVEHYGVTLAKFTVTAGLATVAIWGLKKVMSGRGGGQMELFGGGKGGGILGNLFGGMSWGTIGKFAAIMVVLAGSMWLLGTAMQTFIGIEWKTLAIAGAAIVGLLVVVGALGALMANPVVTAAIIAGGLAIAGLGLAFNILGEGISKIGTGLESIATGLKEIIALSTQLSAVEGAAEVIQALAVPMAGGGIAGAATAAGVGGTYVEGTNVNVDLNDVVNKLDEIESMFQDGIDLKLNGAKIGEWLGKEARK